MNNKGQQKGNLVWITNAAGTILGLKTAEIKTAELQVCVFSCRDGWEQNRDLCINMPNMCMIFSAVHLTPYFSSIIWR